MEKSLLFKKIVTFEEIVNFIELHSKYQRFIIRSIINGIEGFIRNTTSWFFKFAGVFHVREHILLSDVYEKSDKKSIKP